MKTNIVVATLVALCSSHVVPRDKNHEVSGANRIVWMPDAEGTPLQVSLDEPVDEELVGTRSGAHNQYWLYTRRNPHMPQVIVHGNSNTVVGSNYNADRILNVIVHGWNSNGNSAMNPLITSAFLAVQDCNVIVVDWRSIANANYLGAVAGVPSVGEHLGNFLIWLINITGSNWNQFHLIGFGLGAHVVGNAGRQTGGRPARITGLDPTGLGGWVIHNKLNPSDGEYVEAIHTDAQDIFIDEQIGDADFFPNRGQHPQPGCITRLCSQNRATELFEATLRFKIYGRECNDLPQALQGRCEGAEFPMGNGDVNKRGSGIYSLSIRATWPF